MRKRKYTFNTEILLNEDALSFYLLGVFFADGHVQDLKHHLSFGISSKDEYWLEQIRDLICPNKPIYNKGSHFFSLEMSDTESMNWLINWGCTPRKSKTVILTKDIPKQYHPDFLRGVVDGDGSLSQSQYTKTKNKRKYSYVKKTLYICSASEAFVQQLIPMVPDCINCCIYNIGKRKSVIKGRVIKATTDMFRLVFNDSNALAFTNHIYYPEHKLSLQRKYDLVKEWNDSSLPKSTS